MKTALSMLMVLLAVLWCSCGENRGDPVSASIDSQYGGTLISGGSRANIEVTDDIRDDFSEVILQLILDSYIESDRAWAKTDHQPYTVRIVGDFVGHAISEKFIPPPDTTEDEDSISVEDTIEVILPDWDEPEYTPNENRVNNRNLRLYYNDFSNSGRLFVGGTVECEAQWGELYPEYVYLDGGLVFAGDYSGSVEFDGFLLNVEVDKVMDFDHLFGIPEGRITIISGTSRISYNPYGFVIGPVNR